MNKVRAVFAALLIILLPVAVLTLSGNGVLRTSWTYGYHFNDIDATGMVESSLSTTELSKEITGYFNSLSDDDFQIYEQNGDYSDPMFDDSEIIVMKRAKNILKLTGIGGIAALVAVIVVYVYLRLWSEKRYLRITGAAGAVITIIALIVKDVLVVSSGFRRGLYTKYIGVILNEESTLKILLGSPMEKTYIVFSSIVAVAIIILFLYINFSLTKERGMFKQK